MLTIILIHVQRGRAHGNRPRIFPFFSLMLSHKKRATDESRTRDLFLTKEALYHWATAACSTHSLFWVPISFEAGLGFLLVPLFSSGRRGSNPPPIAWKAIALPNELLPLVLVLVFRGGGWTRTTELFRGQIYSLLQLPLCDSPFMFVRLLSCSRVPVSSRWRDSNPRQADYKSATLPTELHRLLSTFQTTLFLVDWGCKNTTFFKYDKSFFHFFWNIFDNSL